MPSDVVLAKYGENMNGMKTIKRSMYVAAQTSPILSGLCRSADRSKNTEDQSERGRCSHVILVNFEEIFALQTSFDEGSPQHRHKVKR